MQQVYFVEFDRWTIRLTEELLLTKPSRQLADLVADLYYNLTFIFKFPKNWHFQKTMLIEKN